MASSAPASSGAELAGAALTGAALAGTAVAGAAMAGAAMAVEPEPEAGIVTTILWRSIVTAPLVTWARVSIST